LYKTHENGERLKIIRPQVKRTDSSDGRLEKKVKSPYVYEIFQKSIGAEWR
jgi:hypothetical protein